MLNPTGGHTRLNFRRGHKKKKLCLCATGNESVCSYLVAVDCLILYLYLCLYLSFLPLPLFFLCLLLTAYFLLAVALCLQACQHDQKKGAAFSLPLFPSTRETYCFVNVSDIGSSPVRPPGSSYAKTCLVNIIWLLSQLIVPNNVWSTLTSTSKSL